SKEEDHKAQAIKKALEQRCNNFRDNQTKMYDSLLNRERHVIVLDR
ncbi:1970_t:CDS:1, partial [Funneliformis geosporum]